MGNKTKIYDGTTFIGIDADTLDGKHASEFRKVTDKISTIDLTEPNLIKGITPTLQGVIDTTSANRLAFLPADQIIVEKSTDGGNTWEDAGYSDAIKRDIFINKQLSNYSFGIPLKDGVQSCSCMLRVTITGMKYDVPAGTAETEKYNYWNSNYVKSTERYVTADYCSIWLRGVKNYIQLTVQRATGANPNNWITDGIYNYLSGWDGRNTCKMSNGLGGYLSQTANYWNWRFIFRTQAPDGSFDDTKLKTTNNNLQQEFYSMMLFSKVAYSSSNNMMKNGHIYDWDYQQNTIFPKDVLANNVYSKVNNGYNLGLSDRQWLNAYIKNIYEDGTLLSDKYLGISGTAENAKSLEYTFSKSSESSTSFGYYKIATITHKSWDYCYSTMIINDSYASVYNSLVCLRCSTNASSLRNFNLEIISGNNISARLKYIFTEDSNGNITKIEIYIYCGQYDKTKITFVNKFLGNNNILSINSNSSFGSGKPDIPQNTIFTGTATYGIPTKTSQLSNDSNFLTKDSDISVKSVTASGNIESSNGTISGVIVEGETVKENGRNLGEIYQLKGSYASASSVSSLSQTVDTLDSDVSAVEGEITNIKNNYEKKKTTTTIFDTLTSLNTNATAVGVFTSKSITLTDSVQAGDKLKVYLCGNSSYEQYCAGIIEFELFNPSTSADRNMVSGAGMIMPTIGDQKFIVSASVTSTTSTSTSLSIVVYTLSATNGAPAGANNINILKVERIR